eukprot:767171-Hanusia_phi.AAC.3
MMIQIHLRSLHLQADTGFPNPAAVGPSHYGLSVTRGDSSERPYRVRLAARQSTVGSDQAAAMENDDAGPIGVQGGNMSHHSYLAGSVELLCCRSVTRCVTRSLRDCLCHCSTRLSLTLPEVDLLSRFARLPSCCARPRTVLPPFSSGGSGPLNSLSPPRPAGSLPQAPSSNPGIFLLPPGTSGKQAPG